MINNPIKPGLDIILDSGSYAIKAGFANDEVPRRVCPTVMTSPESGTGNVYMGNNALSKHKRGTPLHPIQFGRSDCLDSWKNMEKMWHHIFYNELCVAPETHRVLLTECRLDTKPRINYGNMGKIMFENFSVPAIYIYPQAVLALYANGFTTGITVNSGYQTTEIVPIWEGYRISRATKYLNLGGIDLTNYMAKILHAESQPKYVIRDIKERVAYVSLDSEEETRVFRQKTARETFLTWALSNRRSCLQNAVASATADDNKMEPKDASQSTLAAAPTGCFDTRNSIRFLQNVKRYISSFSWKVLNALFRILKRV